MTIKDEVVKAREERRKKLLDVQVKITDDIRKEIIELLSNGKNNNPCITLNANMDNTEDNQFFEVKQICPARWYRKARYEVSYRKGSILRLIGLLREEGIDAYVTKLSITSITLKVSLIREPYFPFTPILTTEESRIQELL